MNYQGFNTANNNNNNNNNIINNFNNNNATSANQSYNSNDNDKTDNKNLISSIGVSQRLGSSVLNELDSRTNVKFQQLSNDMNPINDIETQDESFSRRFNITHDSQFRSMESVQNHYSVKFESENDQSMITSNNNNNNNNEIYSTPSKKNIQQEQLHSSSIKRLKTTTNLLSTPPPVLDITRRIRRLRLRNSLVGNGARDHHETSIINSKVKNTPITKPQKPLETPNFLKPTLTSLNRMKKSQASNNLHSNLKPQKLRIPSSEEKKTKKQTNTTRSISVSISNVKNKMNLPSSTGISSTNKGSDRRVKSTGSSTIPKSESVFDRLYNQSTVSRSTSMNNINNHTKPISNVNSSKTSNIKFGRSKTSSTISSNLSSSDSSNSMNSRPAWR